MKSPRRPSPSRGLKDFVIVCRHERRPPQSRRPPAHRYPATPRRRHDRLRRTRKPVVHCSVYKDPPLWYLQRLWYLQSARYAQDGAKLNAGRWQNGANRDLHHHRRAKHTPRQGDRPLLRRPLPDNLHAAPRRRSLLAGTRRTINRRHHHHLVLRPRSLGTALHYPLRRQPHRHGRSVQKGRMKADASPAHALAQHSRCQIAPDRFFKPPPIRAPSCYVRVPSMDLGPH